MSNALADRALRGEVERTLRCLHINETIMGLKYLVYAVSETVIDPNRTYLITKDLYREIARKYKTTPTRAERDICWAIHISWESARNRICHTTTFRIDIK